MMVEVWVPGAKIALPRAGQYALARNFSILGSSQEIFCPLAKWRAEYADQSGDRKDR
jgi:hypothetical protein